MSQDNLTLAKIIEEIRNGELNYIQEMREELFQEILDKSDSLLFLGTAWIENCFDDIVELVHETFLIQ